MLRLKLLAAFFLVFMATFESPAQTPGNDRFGLGAVIGSPTAITGKYWTAQDEAVDFGLGFWGYSWTVIYGDYHWVYPGLFGRRTRFVSQLLPYLGVGGGLVFWSERRDCGRWNCADRGSGTAVFVRIPFGIEWYPVRPPLGVFVELIPGITIIPGTSGSFDFGLGVRYYF